jgi:predicted phosphodiesterase
LLVDEYQFITEALNQNKSWPEITKEFNNQYKAGLTAEAVRKRFAREVSKLEVLGDDNVEKAFRLIKANPMKPTELAKRFNLDMDGLEDLIDDLLNSRTAIKFHQSYLVFDRLAPQPDNFNHKIDLFRDEGWLKVGLYADPHICSIHEQIGLLHNFYKLCEEEKCAAMFCSGDITPGNGNVYKGQLQDLKIVGADKQIAYTCSVWPDTNLMTYAVSGNHDLDLYKTAGIDIVQQIADKLDNFTYLGKMSASVDCNGVRFLIHHGDGGLGAVRSYKPQRILDAQKVEDICDVSVLGHWHITLYMPSYRNSIVILPGCFEAQSDYLIKKSLVPDITGVILHLKIADINGIKKIVRHKVDLIDYGVLLGG